MSAVLSPITSIAGGLLSFAGSKSAANSQEDAANTAAQTQLQMYNQNRQDLSTYRNLGTNASNDILNALGYTSDSTGKITGTDSSNPLQQTFSFDSSKLDQTPGYQFNLTQGLNAANASAAARGLGVSGADVKGAQSYAEGLADNYYNNYYNQALNTYQTNYNSAANNANRLYQLVNLGENASAQTAQQGASAAMNAGNYATSGANAAASGTIAGTNALTNSLTNAGNSYMQNQILAAIYANNSSSQSSFSANPSYTQSYSVGNF